MNSAHAAGRPIARWPWSRGAARPDDPAAFADLSGVVVASIPCPYCEYDLHGSKLGQACPECGKPIGYAQNAELLIAAPAGWLKRVRRGPQLVLLSVAIGMLGGCIGSAWAMFISRAGAGPTGNFAAFAPPTWMLVLNIATYASFLGGSYLFSTARPNTTPPERPFSRQAIRWLLLVTAIAWLISMPTTFMSGTEFDPTAPLPIALGLIGGAAAGLLWFASFRQIAWVLLSAPTPAWARLADVLSWVALAGALASTLVSTIAALEFHASAQSRPPYGMPIGTTTVVISTGTAPTSSLPTTTSVQYLYVDASGNTQVVTTLPAGTPVVAPPAVRGSFFVFGLLGCGSICVIVPALILMLAVLWRLDRELGDAIRIAGFRELSPSRAAM